MTLNPMSDEKSYDIAYACAECIMQNATLQSGSVSYNVARDQYMADKVATIMNLEAYKRIMISGHNGHIQKKSSNASYTCMGELLSKEYKTAYYTIGTDFMEGEVDVINGSGNEKHIHIKSENALKKQLQNLDGKEKQFDIQTYKEIIAFSEGQKLDEIEKNREKEKRPCQKTLIIMASGVVTLIIAVMFGLLLKG